MSALPTSIGKYRVTGVLGKGAMGLVYRAEDPLLGRQVAIKVITGDEVTDEMKERFHVEARAAAALAHPNIIVIYDLGEEAGTPYIAMELLHGEDLRTLANRRRDLPVEEAAELIAQVCEGLAYAHERRIVHRDIKPANIHVCPDGRAKVVDFGIAKVDSTSLTATGMVIGTPDYMSPEQIQGKSVDARSDIFSLGVVFYELLAGDKPFAAESITSVIYNIVFKQPRPFAELSRPVPPEIERIVEKAMAKELPERYQRISDMAADIRRWLSSSDRNAPVPVLASGDDATSLLSSDATIAALAPQAGATLQVGESAARRKAAAAAPPGSSSAAEEGTRIAQAPQRSRVPLIAAIAAGLVLVVAGVLFMTKDTDPSEQQPSAASVAPVPVEVLVVPWARLDRLVDLADESRDLPLVESTTPLRLDLPPGRYRAEVSNQDLGLAGSFTFNVVSGAGPMRATHVLEGFDPRAAFGELQP